MTPGRFRSTNRDILVESIGAYRVASAHLRTPGLGCVLQSMSDALKLGGGRAASSLYKRDGLVWIAAGFATRNERRPYRLQFY
jgi:hypothetical protein